mmetsp:Transcript_37033/g.86421  ORF Transcript_37033/g.86421 Transcript_37033/m.86421 type:complete len:222 (-) Transcript_37033:38-703(-)|eukprot:CAMPEP_0113310480 /NCGR_PEP_ID=MMETSP0010_2-20120614/8110_1 /TAXON_ID=216773 ORGANISM="Corethron hystrix, Strain 308" /NCGR_SAMPLE_ID=MMETSP0010_2 /ASSEMBLY_ACC=CAM_ASM_000155 /LENGTH=221 /DNA_ID=CAMNT_0000165947 /DNA_START=54 /DNA_END=719 /DNA_ORIENTATION=+ /assembly_acc=CAM_ASM_000155
MKAVRIIVVWGSETNQTKNEISNIADKWNTDGNVKAVKILEGDKAAEEFDRINSSNYDVIIVATSSYGFGDAPSGYGKFLYQLYESSKNGEMPFKGMQHAVLGMGSTVYETFQNCPRLTDKLIGESGSIRCVKRLEIDEMEDGNEEKIEEWAKEVEKAFGETPKLEPVCDWSEPADEIIDKVLGPDGFELVGGSTGGSTAGPLLAAAGVAIAAAYYYYRNQ